MLEILDAIIATAAIILGLSLIVQAIEQIVKQTFDLKSAYMRSELLALFTAANTGKKFLANFQTIGRLGRQADEVARRIVKELEERLTTFGFTDLHLLEDVDGKKLKGIVEGLPIAGDTTLKEKFEEALKQIDTWFEFSRKAFQEHYERRMRLWAFVISLFVVMATNADVIGIYRDFASSKTRRDAVVASVPKLLDLAERQIKDASRVSDLKYADQQIDSVIRKKSALIDSLAMDRTLDLFRWNTPTGNSLRFSREEGGSLLRGINDFFAALWKNKLGWLAMALLVSLGAPFWYDFLKTVMGVKDKLKGGSNRKENSSSPINSSSAPHEAQKTKVVKRKSRRK